MKKVNKKGFTLVELVIVIAVIAILAAVLIPTFATVIEKGKRSAALQAVRNEITEMKVALAVKGIDIEDGAVFEKDGFRFIYKDSLLQESKAAVAAALVPTELPKGIKLWATYGATTQVHNSTIKKADGTTTAWTCTANDGGDIAVMSGAKAADSAYTITITNDSGAVVFSDVTAANEDHNAWNYGFYINFNQPAGYYTFSVVYNNETTPRTGVFYFPGK